VAKAVGQGDKTTQRVRARARALLENRRRDRVRVLTLQENPLRERVRDPALRETPRRERVLDCWFEARDSSVSEGNTEKPHHVAFRYFPHFFRLVSL
jgi:hypothetical protein